MVSNFLYINLSSNGGKSFIGSVFTAVNIILLVFGDIKLYILLYGIKWQSEHPFIVKTTCNVRFVLLYNEIYFIHLAYLKFDTPNFSSLSSDQTFD